MDLGISGRRALVCAASQGLGWECALASSREGVAVVITGRTREKLSESADRIRVILPQADVRFAVGDLSTPEGRAEALAA